jgi:hypothetical protein
MLTLSVTLFSSVVRPCIRKSSVLIRPIVGMLCVLLIVAPSVGVGRNLYSSVSISVIPTQGLTGEWELVALPGDDQYASADFSPADGWALGTHRLAHWDGNRWTSYPPPEGYAEQNPLEVKVLSPHDAWILAAGGVMFHWDGSQWKKTHLPVSNDSNDEPEFMAFASPTIGWVVGGGERQANLYAIIFEWNGYEWIRKEVSDMGGFWGIDVVTPTEGWMAESKSHLWHWNGQEWKRYDAQTFSGDFTALAMVNSGDGWMAREDISPRATLWHWDGIQWREFQEVLCPIYSIVMVESDFGWAVGLDFATKRNLLLHWDGTAWSKYPIKADSPLFYVRANSTEDGWIWGGDSWDLSKLDSGKDVVFRYRLVPAVAPTASATASASPTASPTTRPTVSATATLVSPTATHVTLTPTPPPPTPTLPLASVTPTPPLSTNRSAQNLPLWVMLAPLLLLVVGGTMALVYRRLRG